MDIEKMGGELLQGVVSYLPIYSVSHPRRLPIFFNPAVRISDLARVKSALWAQILLSVCYDSILHTDCCKSDHTPVQPQIILLCIILSISRIKNRFKYKLWALIYSIYFAIYQFICSTIIRRSKKNG